MKTRYREIQYFPSYVYIALGAAGVAAIILFLVAGMFWGALAGCGLVLIAGFVLALGRMTVLVTEQSLRVSFGWFNPMVRSFELSGIDRVRVRLLDRADVGFSRGWRKGKAGSFCYNIQRRGAVELVHGNDRYWIGSRQPTQLRDAIAGDSRPIPPREQDLRRLLRRPPARRDANWALLKPQECRELQAVGR